MELLESRYQRIKKAEENVKRYYNIWGPGKKHVYISSIRALLINETPVNHRQRISKTSVSPSLISQKQTPKRLIRAKRMQEGLFKLTKDPTKEKYKGTYSNTVISKASDIRNRSRSSTITDIGK